MARIRGSSRATVRGVKALDTSRRSRVWSGGSSDRNDGRSRARRGGAAPAGTCRARCWPADRAGPRAVGVPPDHDEGAARTRRTAMPPAGRPAPGKDRAGWPGRRARPVPAAEACSCGGFRRGRPAGSGSAAARRRRAGHADRVGERQHGRAGPGDRAAAGRASSPVGRGAQPGPGPRGRAGRWRRSMACRCSAAPAGVALPSGPSSPRPASRAAAASHSSSVQPRAGCICARLQPADTWLGRRRARSTPVRSASASRRVEIGGDQGGDVAVAAVFPQHGGGVPEPGEGSAGTGSAAFAAPSVRPASSGLPSGPAAVSGGVARHRPRSVGQVQQAAQRATAPASRTASASAGVIRSQTPGIALATMPGANEKNEATTGAAPVRPRGAARPAK